MARHFMNKVKSLKADGGTNYDQGFQKGKTAIDSARSDAKKVVIFLTDGQPTIMEQDLMATEVIQVQRL